MIPQSGLLLLAGLLAIATGVALRLRGKSLRAILWSGTVLGVLLLVAALNQPVAPADTSDDGTDILYIGLHDSAYLERLGDIRSSRAMTLVGLPAAKDLIARHAPWAKFEPPAGSADSSQGITLTVAIEDLRSRLGQLRSGGKVYFLVPRTDDVARDKAALDGLVREAPWIAPRLVCLFPGSGKLRSWPPLPGLKGEAPAVIDQNTPKYPAEVAVDVPALSDVKLHGGVYSDSRSSLRFDDAKQQLSAQNTSGQPTRLRRGTTLYRGELPSPGPGRTSTVSLRLTTSFGESVAALQLVTRCESPEVPILIPAGKQEAHSDLAKLLRTLNIPVRPVVIDLPDPAGATIPGNPEHILKVQTPKLRDIGMLFVDIELTKGQGENLVQLLEMAGKENGSAPTLVFVGTDGQPSPPQGWHPFLSGMGFQQAVGRQVALVTDLSGSMRAQVTKDYPQLVDKTLPDPSKTRKIDIAYRIARHLHDKLQQRDVNGVLLPVKNRYPYKKGWAMGDHDGKGQDGVPCQLNEYCAGDPVHHHWEGGPHLVAIRRLIENDKLPISDVFMVWDCDDITGNDIGNWPHTWLTDQQKEAAQWLTDRNVRLHIISIGGTLNGGDLHPGVPDIVRSRVILRFPEMKSLEDLLDRVERHVFETVLPRLPVTTEPEAMKPLPQVKTEALARAASNPDLRLINVLHKYVDRAADTRKADILLWGGHFSPAATGLGSPLFMRGRYQSPGGAREAYWLTLDLRAEMAASEKAGAKQRNALADLVIAAVNVVTDSLNRPPVVWQIDSTGQVRAMARDRRPFNLDKVEAKLRAAPGRPDSGAQLDTRQLTYVGFRFPGLRPEESCEAEVLLVDHDPSIGEQRIRMPLTGTPPLPLVDLADRDLFGKDYANQDEPREAGAASERGYEGVPAFYMGLFVVIVWLLWAVYAWRG
jgi:hypothetical protein